MLFNSYAFILCFLPVTVVTYYVSGRRLGRNTAFWWLTAASLVFYAWWHAVYPFLVLASIGVNFFLGRKLAEAGDAYQFWISRKTLLKSGILFNLIWLGTLKYTDFFVENINQIASINIESAKLILPLAVSYYTFQQISYIVDAYQGKTEKIGFLKYLLFVTFYPKLIAGPITTYSDMAFQLAKSRIARLDVENLSVGITIFCMGLIKKAIIAESAARYADPVFIAAADGIQLTFFEAWGGLLAYTFQIYFDFSAYSDMAIGVARMFGFLLPENFNSPYKSRNIIEFWRRWHITLANFVKNYIYIPLGGNRRGELRKYFNLMVAWVLVGLWHGAGWTFVLWGTAHGLFLWVNHLWRKIPTVLHIQSVIFKKTVEVVSIFITFLVASLAWVLFRAPDVSTSLEFYKGLFGMHGFSLPLKFKEQLNDFFMAGDFIETMGFSFHSAGELFNETQIVWLTFMALVVWLMPNVQQIMAAYRPCLNDTSDPIPTYFRWLLWRPNTISLAVILVVFLVGFLSLQHVSEFIYFQF